VPLPPDLAPLAPLVDEPERAAFLVDFDGSLAPIVDDPAAARPLPAARAGLARLAARVGRVAVVSGRPAGFLAEHLPIDGLMVVGLYGLERVVAGVREVDPRATPWIPVMGEVADELEARLPDLLVERKGDLAVTVHWRTKPVEGEAAAAVVAAVSAAHGLESPMRGRMAMEVRPPVPVDKGTATRELVSGMRAAAFAGDDIGDLPAFAALRGAAATGGLTAGVSIGVRSPEAPPEILAAVVVVDGPPRLAQLMDALADAVDERR
jgi:trehalose 6-phosphate phosphatase